MQQVLQAQVILSYCCHLYINNVMMMLVSVVIVVVHGDDDVGRRFICRFFFNLNVVCGVAKVDRAPGGRALSLATVDRRLPVSSICLFFGWWP